MSITYKENTLCIDNLLISSLSKKYKTPFYVYSSKQMAENLTNFKNAISCINGKVFYSVKANSNLSVLKYFNSLGCGFDIVSFGELLRLKEINCPASNIVFSGVGKTENDLKEAILYGIKSINIESLEELEDTIKICNELNKKANIMLRINPNISAKTHEKISTGKKGDKFGIDLNMLPQSCRTALKEENINLIGLACHIGSQIFDIKSFKESYIKVLQTAKELEKQGVNIKTLDLGGGFGVPYKKDDKSFNLQEFSTMLKEVFAKESYEVCFEPGRFLSANTGLLITKATRVKKQNDNIFAIIDGSMADLLRPTLYNAYHELKKVEKNQALQEFTYDIVGPICETGDIFHKKYKIEEIKKDDLLAFFNCGSYSASMSSNYNSTPLTREVFILNNKDHLIREQNYKNLFALENTIS